MRTVKIDSSTRIGSAEGEWTMTLSPEQKQAWEKEKQAREQRVLTPEEVELKRRRDEARIDKAIKKTARLEKIRKWTYIAVVAIYVISGALYLYYR